MAVNRGKQFEAKVAEDLAKVSDFSVERLPDQMSGYRGSKNTCDYLCYKYPHFYYIECKTTNENTFPLSALTQYDALLARKGRKGVRSGVLLWFVKHDTVVYVPIATFEQIKNDGLKSVNIKMLNDDTYRLIVVPSIKKRVFLDSDYTILSSLQEGD